MPRRHVVAHKKLSQEVYRLLWTSLILSCFIFCVSLKLWGAASLWLNPSGSFLTAFYSLFLIVRLRKQRALANSPSRIPSIPPTCSQESILCALYLATYFAAGLLVILIMASKIAVHGRSAVPVMLVEGMLVAAEVAILATLALKCTHERKTVGIPQLSRLPGHPSRLYSFCGASASYVSATSDKIPRGDSDLYPEATLSDDNTTSNRLTQLTLPRYALLGGTRRERSGSRGREYKMDQVHPISMSTRGSHDVQEFFGVGDIGEL